MTTQTPWYRRCLRWGQTNLTELDPARYDAEWWRTYWRRTRIQGVIVNAGGIVAYYPSAFPEVHRAETLGERDLFGEIAAAAHEDGLAVLARMDSNRVHERFFIEHPDWIAVDADGRPYRAGELYVTCINSPYYREFLPDVLREIVARSRPEGFTDNSWSGLDRGRICHCRHCRARFRADTGLALPGKPDWESPAYRRWIEWSYGLRIEIWELNNRTTKEAGGTDCLWVGMLGGDPISQSGSLRDIKAIAERTEIIFLDSQARRNAGGFQANAESGQLLHGLLGWEKLIPESTAMYQNGQPTFRVASKPEPEARLWAFEGFAGGIQPWWHHIGAYHEDRRQYRTTVPLFRWHEANERYLVDRRPVASIGLLWSRQNVDFYGRDAAEARVAQPRRGFANALIRARLPFLPVHIDHLERDGAELSVLVLPNLGALSDAQCEAVRRFVERGGSVIASGETSLYDEWGDRRSDFGLADVLGVHHRGAHHGGWGEARGAWDDARTHTYLRLHPELRAGLDGPRTGNEPPVAGARHDVLTGFEETDLLPFGGRLELVQLAAPGEPLLSFVPHFPIYPPETAWMRHPATTLPGLALRETPAGGRIAYLAADLDRCYGRDYLPDHGRLLANLVRWAARGRLPLAVDGAGFVDCRLYRQEGRLILHLVNLTSAETWRAPIHELIPVGPLKVRLRLPEGVRGTRVRLCVNAPDETAAVQNEGGWADFTVPSLADHELALIE